MDLRGMALPFSSDTKNDVYERLIKDIHVFYLKNLSLRQKKILRCKNIRN